MQQRFSAKETHVSNPASVQDLQSRVQTVRVEPAQVFARDFSIGEIAEITGGVAGIRDGYVAKSGTAVTQEAQRVPNFRGPHDRPRSLTLPHRRDDIRAYVTRYIHWLPYKSSASIRIPSIT